MGGKRQYTAVFAIGAKLLGSFRGAMSMAQARLRGLQKTANRVTSGIGKLAGAFTGLFAVFGTFLAANIIGKIFSTATDEAVEAEERTNSLLDSLMQMDSIRKKGPAEAQKQLDLIFKHNKALEAQGVLHKDVLDTMSVQLAMGKIPSRDIQRTVDVMQNMLIKAKGVRGANEENAKEMAQKFVIAARKGTIKGLGLGIPAMLPEQAKAFKKMSFPQRVQELIRLGKAVGTLNKNARSTPIGRVMLFNNAIQDLAQDVGDALLPAQAEMADAWREALPELKPLLIEGMKVLFGLVKDLGSYVKTDLIPWWHEFQKSEKFAKIIKALQWVKDHLKPIAITIGVIVAALLGLNAIVGLIGIIGAIASPIGLIVIAIMAVVAAVAILYAKWDTVRAMFPQTAAVVEHFIEGFKISFKTGFDFVIAIWKSLVALFTGDWKGVGDAWAKVWGDMGAIAEWWKKTLIEVAKAVGQAFKDYFLRVFEDIKGIWNWMKGFSWEGIKKAFGAAEIPADIQRGTGGYAEGGIVTKPEVARIAENGPEAIIPLTKGIDQINSLKSLQDYLVTQQPKGKGALATGDASRAWKNVKDSFTKPWTSMWSDVSSLYNTIKTTGRLPQPEPTYLGTGKPTPLHGMIDMPRKTAPTHVNFAPVVTINGTASEKEQQALDQRLRDLARDFVADFKRAQTHERRLSYEGGYG